MSAKVELPSSYDIPELRHIPVWISVHAMTQKLLNPNELCSRSIGMSSRHGGSAGVSSEGTAKPSGESNMMMNSSM